MFLPTKDLLRKSASALACCLVVSATASCTRSDQPDIARTRTTWTVAVPTVLPRTLEEALRIIGSDPSRGPNTLFVGDLSAAVFAFADDRPDTEHLEWKKLIGDLCGPSGLLGRALSAGWDVTVTGFVDSTGPTGPGTFNDQLQASRADGAARELATACRIPSDRIHTAKGGVGGEGAAGRKVRVDYTRTGFAGTTR